MTATATMPDSTTDTWAAQFAALKARYKHVREPILVALHILTQNPDISADDAKAQAQVHGTRITAASISAAQRLLARMDDRPTAGAAPEAASTTRAAPAAPHRAARASRGATPAPDAEALIRNVVAKVQSQGAAEAARLREAMRKAIAVLQAAVGS